ncbi:MAG: succinate dehydrogenase [Thaumarchaeota archaeon]|nr:succinate dehydrogenase [Nitrososphaerota archaeon]
MKLDWRLLIPYELLEPNWRLWSFVGILTLGFWALLAFPMAEFAGYIDPFYSPTILIVPLPGAFRLTCYAYRKDYHRHIFNHPLGCANADRGESASRHYTGERSAVFQLENFHRYFMYAGIAILPFFYYDFYHSLISSGTFELRLGSLLLLANAITLTGWTVSCHAFRHVIGGNVDCYSCVAAGGPRKDFYDRQSWLNKHHEALAWISLLTIILVDLYLRGLAAGLPIDKTLLRF